MKTTDKYQVWLKGVNGWAALSGPLSHKIAHEQLRLVKALSRNTKFKAEVRKYDTA